MLLLKYTPYIHTRITLIHGLNILLLLIAPLVLLKDKLLNPKQNAKLNNNSLCLKINSYYKNSKMKITSYS